MTFEFLKWRPSFETYKRGVKKGDLLYKRPIPWLDLNRKAEWVKFLYFSLGGIILAGIIGIICYFVVSGFAGGLVLTITAWIYIFVGGWIVFWILHLVHSIRFRKIAKLTDVEFVSLNKARAIGKRILTMPQDLTVTDYNILFSRYIWADIECEPYRDVTEWVERIESVQFGGQAVAPTVGGKSMPEAMGDAFGKGIGYAIGEKYSKSRLKEIIDTAGGIPSPQEIVKILQTELIPRYRDLLGERLAMLYLLFLSTQPPILPYDKKTSRSELRRVAEVSDTKEVLDYLKPFSEKMEEV